MMRLSHVKVRSNSALTERRYSFVSLSAAVYDRRLGCGHLFEESADRCNPEGCKKVARGRSAAETLGAKRINILHPRKGVPRTSMNE